MFLKNMIRAFVLGAAAVLAGAAGSAAPDRPGALPPLAAYHAVYDLSLAQTSRNGTLTAARGRIAFDFSGTACDGYVENFHQVTELHPAEGAARLSDLRSNTYEGGDGKDFRFEIESRLDNEPAEKLGGKARKSADSALAVDLAKPAPKRAEFPADALFPAEHLRRILAAALKEERILEAKVYDGSDDGFRLLDTTTIIGKATTGAVAEKAAQIEPLSKLRRWPVSISYFDVNEKDAPPLYAMSFDLYENGVSRALRLDYGDFALIGEMTELSLLPTPAGCDR